MKNLTYKYISFVKNKEAGEFVSGKVTRVTDDGELVIE